LNLILEEVSMALLSLSDEEMAVIWAAAEPIPRHRRGDFLKAVANALAANPAVGPGNIHRAIRETQREFLSGWLDSP
jgi:hypothetical protein